MRLSWNEVRARAAAFAQDWRDAAYEKGETQSFYNDFFAVFGVQRRSIARYVAHVAKLDNRYDPNPMPPDPHRALDRAVDKLYRRTPSATERERIEHLFALYEKIRTPLEAGTKGKRRRRRTAQQGMAERTQ